MPEQFPTPLTEKPTQSDESKTMQQLGEVAMSESEDSMGADAALEVALMGHQANEEQFQKIVRGEPILPKKEESKE